MAPSAPIFSNSAAPSSDSSTHSRSSHYKLVQQHRPSLFQKTEPVLQESSNNITFSTSFAFSTSEFNPFASELTEMTAAGEFSSDGEDDGFCNVVKGDSSHGSMKRSNSFSKVPKSDKEKEDHHNSKSDEKSHKSRHKTTDDSSHHGSSHHRRVKHSDSNVSSSSSHNKSSSHHKKSSSRDDHRSSDDDSSHHKKEKSADDDSNHHHTKEKSSEGSSHHHHERALRHSSSTASSSSSHHRHHHKEESNKDNVHHHHLKRAHSTASSSSHSTHHRGHKEAHVVVEEQEETKTPEPVVMEQQPVAHGRRRPARRMDNEIRSSVSQYVVSSVRSTVHDRPHYKAEAKQEDGSFEFDTTF